MVTPVPTLVDAWAVFGRYAVPMDEWMDWLHERRSLLIVGLLAALLGFWWWGHLPVTHPPGALAADDPIQTAPESPASWTFKNHRITPLAHFDIRARVLSTERYRFDRPSQLSPVDFALGWGPMSDTKILGAITIQQRDRWYFWSSADMPISSAAISSHSANMHMVPANHSVENRLLAVRVGQIVELHGQLIRADGNDDWHWVSSLSREDTGDGSCEVVWVESVLAADH